MKRTVIGDLRICLVALLALCGALTEAARAEDVIVTRQQTYRGTVRSVTADGIQFEIPAMGVITIPRNAVTQMRVAPPPAITRGIAAYERGNMREARQSLDRVVFQYQGLDTDWAVKALVYFGRACMTMDDVRNAESAFKAFMQMYPDHDMAVNARLGLAEIKLLNKNYEEALEELREMAEVYDSQFKPPADQIPYAAGVYMGIGKALEAQQELLDALNAYLRVIALYPDPARYPEALYHTGMVFAALDEYVKAERFLNDLFDQHPDHEMAKQAAAVKDSISAKARAMEPAETP